MLSLFPDSISSLPHLGSEPRAQQKPEARAGISFPSAASRCSKVVRCIPTVYDGGGKVFSLVGRSAIGLDLGLGRRSQPLARSGRKKEEELEKVTMR